MPFVVRRNFASQDDAATVLAEPPVEGTFPTREEAEAERDRLEGELRKGNPFDIYQEASVCDLTSLEPGILCDWMQDGGIEPPAPDEWGRRDWEGWWDESSGKWSAEQRAHAWGAFDKLRVYEVAEVRPTRKLYVIMRRGWRWHDEPPYTSSIETMAPHEAFTTREKAEARLEVLAAEQDTNCEHVWTDTLGQHGSEDPAAIPFFEIIEIEEEQ